MADVSNISGMKQLASEANKLGSFDTVIHNAGVGYTQPSIRTADGFAHVFAINSLAPYVLTTLMERPKRLIYVSSGLHYDGDNSLEDVTWSNRRWSAFQAYSDSKLQNVVLAFAVARMWKDVESVAMSPGWVKTKMGGSGAPGSAESGASHLIRLASMGHLESGRYFAPEVGRGPHSAADDSNVQRRYIRICQSLSGVTLAVS